MTSAELKHRAKLQERAIQIQNFRNSGLPVRAWCRQEGINVSTYYRWEQELLTAAKPVLRCASRDLCGTAGTEGNVLQRCGTFRNTAYR